jgi:uncharacterized protein (DUF608 family)
MKVKTENNELVAASIYGAEILSDGLGLEQVTEEEAQDALTEMYVLGYNEEIGIVFNPSILSVQSVDVTAINKRNLWERLKKAICDFIKGEGSTVWGEILEKVLEFVSNIIPGGKLIKRLVKIIVKYIIGSGLGRLCPSV